MLECIWLTRDSLRLLRRSIDRRIAFDFRPAAELWPVSADPVQLQQVLDSLSQTQADLLRASFFDDKSHMQIAQERNMPLGTVKSQLRRTLIRLRAALSDMA